jgi:hypothetical protein
MLSTHHALLRRSITYCAQKVETEVEGIGGVNDTSVKVREHDTPALMAVFDGIY